MQRFPSLFARLSFCLAVLCGASSSLGARAQAPQKAELLNVSYDPTRELYTAYSTAFTKYWQDKTGQSVTIKQSHGGSGKHGRSVSVCCVRSYSRVD
jgi:sulfate transport system substrate-binding protein